MMTDFRFPRRSLLAALAGGASLAILPACSENAATGRNQLMLVNDAQLAQMSAGAWEDAKRQFPPSQDRAAQRRLEQICRRVADASGQSGLDWEFVLFDSQEINAFVLPGGKVGFFRGLFDLAGSDGEIAAVMGHEAGHVVARHAAERMSQQMALQAGVVVAQIALGESLGQFADEAAAALGMGVMYGIVLPYSRAHELEADRLGVDLMSQAAYAPGDASRFWRRMIETSAERPQPLEWLSTHPADDVRLAALEARIAASGAG
jgi:predicted Zn-dependent protease